MNLHLGPTCANLAACPSVLQLALVPGLRTGDHNPWVKEVMSVKAHRKCSVEMGAVITKTELSSPTPGPRPGSICGRNTEFTLCIF